MRKRSVELALLCLCACSKHESSPPPPKVVDAAARPAPRDAAPPSTLIYASVDLLLGLDGKTPGDAIAGYPLGATEDTDGHDVAAPGWSGTANPIVDDAGRVTHVVLELLPDDGSPPGAIDAVIAAAAKAWGAPATVHGRKVWSGPRGQIFLTTFDGFLRGTPSLLVDLLAPGDTYVCGAHDGFDAFYRALTAAAKQKDRAAFTAMFANPPPDPDDDDPDASLCDGKDLLACAAPLFGHRLQCSVSGEMYTVDNGKLDGGEYLSFTRDDGTWKAYGPHSIGHDDDLQESAPY